MSIRVVCPSCHTTAACPDEYRGRSVRCKSCGRSFVAGVSASRHAERVPVAKPASSRLVPLVVAAVVLAAAIGIPAGYLFLTQDQHGSDTGVGPRAMAADTQRGRPPLPAGDTGRRESTERATRPAPVVAVAWQEFTSPEWGFRASFPAAPQATSPPSNGARRSQVFSATSPRSADGRPSLFSITCTDCDPRQSMDAGAFLAAETADVARHATDKAAIKLGTFPGLELREEKEDAEGGAGGWLIVRRVYLVHSRLYALHAGGPKEVESSLKQFLNSFALLDPNPPAPVARTLRERAADWTAEHAAAPADRVVDEAKRLLAARANDGAVFTLSLGEGLLKAKKPAILAGWGDELLVLEPSVEQARQLKLGERDVVVAAYPEPPGRRSAKPLLTLSDLKTSGSGSNLGGAVAYRGADISMGAIALRLSFVGGPALRVERQPANAKGATGSLTFRVPPVPAGSPATGPVVLVAEVCSDDGERVLSNPVAMLLTRPQAAARGGIAELQLSFPAGWEGHYNKFLGGVGGWPLTKAPPTPRSEPEELRIEECPADARTVADYTTHLKQKDFLNVDVPAWVELGQPEELSDGFMIKGIVKKPLNAKAPPTLGLVAVRDIAGLKVRCYSANLRSEKSRDEALEVFKSASFAAPK
jgi:hypothetical protein